MSMLNVFSRWTKKKSPKPRRCARRRAWAESLEDRIVLSAVVGAMQVDAPPEATVEVEDLTPQGWALGDLNLRAGSNNDAAAEATTPSDVTLRGFAIADLGMQQGAQRRLDGNGNSITLGGQGGDDTVTGDPALRGLVSHPLEFGGQKGEDTSSGGVDPGDVTPRGLVGSPIGFAGAEGTVLRGLASSPLGLAGQEGREATSSKDSHDGTVLRGFASSPMGLVAEGTVLKGLSSSPLGLGGQEGEESSSESNGSNDDRTLKGFADSPLGVQSPEDGTVLKGLASIPLGLSGGQDDAEGTSDDDSGPTARVLRGLSSSPLGLTADGTSAEAETPNGPVLPPAPSSPHDVLFAHYDTLLADAVLTGEEAGPPAMLGFESGDVSRWSNEHGSAIPGGRSAPVAAYTGLEFTGLEFHADPSKASFESGDISSRESAR